MNHYEPDLIPKEWGWMVFSETAIYPFKKFVHACNINIYYIHIYDVCMYLKLSTFPCLPSQVWRSGTTWSIEPSIPPHLLQTLLVCHCTVYIRLTSLCISRDSLFTSHPAKAMELQTWATLPVLHAFWELELRFLHLCGKLFTLWAISPVLFSF